MTSSKISLAASTLSTINEEQNMKSSTWKRIFRSSAILVLSGVASIAAAAPQLFPVTATVQNAVTLTNSTPMSFGTVFATRTASNAAPAATMANKLAMSATGTMTETLATVGTPPQVKSLVAGTAGVFTSPGMPANSTVKVTITNVTGDVITNAATTAAASCLFDTSAAAITATTGLKIAMTHSAGDPNTGFFCADAFVSDRTGILGTGVLQATGGAGYALGFGITTLTFNLGAALVQQVHSTAPATYEAGVYTGQVGLEVSFP